MEVKIKKESRSKVLVQEGTYVMSAYTMNGKPQWEMTQSERAHQAIWYDSEIKTWKIGEKVIHMSTVLPDFVNVYASIWYSESEIPNFNNRLPWLVRIPIPRHSTRDIRRRPRKPILTTVPKEEEDFEMRTISPKIEYFVESLAPLSPPLPTFTSSFEMMDIEIEKKKKNKTCSLL